MWFPVAAGSNAELLLEVGAVLLLLALAARLADRFEFSPIPVYLVAGLAIGAVLDQPRSFSEDVVETGAQIGLVLLLFMLGLEYSGDDLREALRNSARPAVLDGVLNFTPGFLAGLALGWGAAAAVLLGGVTYISSSGVIAKLLGDLDRLGNRETPAVLGLLVMEDLVMAVYLPIVVVITADAAGGAGVELIAVALAAAFGALVVAIRFGDAISDVLKHRSDEVLLLTALGVALLIAGAAEALQVSAAVGAFLAGIVFSGALADRASELLAPLRDLFAAVFFAFFGAQIALSELPPVLPVAIGLVVVSALTKLITGHYAAAAIGAGARGRMRAGTALIARGEFSIVIAGIAVATGIESQIGPLSAAYVLLAAMMASFVTRWADSLADRLAPHLRSAA